MADQPHIPRRRFLTGAASAIPALAVAGGAALAASTAEPSAALLDSYDCWLWLERKLLQEQRGGIEALAAEPSPGALKMYAFRGGLREYVPMANAGAQFAFFGDGSGPAGRAAQVLSAVGCDWRGYVADEREFDHRRLYDTA